MKGTEHECESELNKHKDWCEIAVSGWFNKWKGVEPKRLVQTVASKRGIIIICWEA